MKTLICLLISCLAFTQSNHVVDSSNIHSPILDSSIIKANVELKEAFTPFADVEKYGLGIIKYVATDGYSSTGASFKIYNPSKKTIKYIWFTVAGENPVGDLVKSGGVYYKTLRGIGPVKPYNTAEWDFDYVWFTDIIEYLKLSTIKIQYMDGTFKTIKYNTKLYIGEEAYERVLSAVSNQEKAENNSEIPTKKFEHVSEDDQTIFDEVEFKAEFPGGIGALRKSFGDYLDTSQMIDQSGKLETEISFIIEKDGSISNITATGNNEVFNKEALRTIKSIRSKWSPAKINAVKVRSSFKTKFSMNIE